MNDSAELREKLVAEWRNRQQQIIKYIRDFELEKSLIKRFFSKTPNAGFKESPEYQDALAFWRTFETKPEIEYDHLVEYARECLDRCEKTDKSHDDKANSIIQYLGGGTALLIFAASFAVKFDTLSGLVVSLVLLGTLLPSLVFAILAVTNAVFVRFPQESSMLPDVKTAVAITEYFKKKDEIEPRLWMVYHPMIEVAMARNESKAIRLHWAHWFYVAAIWFLLLPLVAMFFSLPIGYSVRPLEKPAAAAAK